MPPLEGGAPTPPEGWTPEAGPFEGDFLAGDDGCRFTGVRLRIGRGRSPRGLSCIASSIVPVVSIAVMGKAGFAYVKNSIMVLLRRYGPPKEVGPIRYYIGLVMWLLPAAYSWILMYATPEMIPGFPEYRIHMALTFDFIFICSFFVLGGDFWDKVRALFIHKAKVRFPEPNKA